MTPQPGSSRRTWATSARVVELLWLDGSGFPRRFRRPTCWAPTWLGSERHHSVDQCGESFVAPSGAVIARVQLRVALESDDVGAAWFDDLALVVEAGPTGRQYAA